MMNIFPRRQQKAWWQLVGQSAAILLLALFALDLGDASCDPLRVAGDLIFDLPVDVTPDACANVCIPDCFCCSTSLTAVPEFILAEPRPSHESAAAQSPEPASGVPHSPDHVPIILA